MTYEQPDELTTSQQLAAWEQARDFLLEAQIMQRVVKLCIELESDDPDWRISQIATVIDVGGDDADKWLDVSVQSRWRDTFQAVGDIDKYLATNREILNEEALLFATETSNAFRHASGGHEDLPVPEGVQRIALRCLGPMPLVILSTQQDG